MIYIVIAFNNSCKTIFRKFFNNLRMYQIMPHFFEFEGLMIPIVV